MLTINTILHPTDFSESSKTAFQMACSLASDYGARLIIIHVYPHEAPPEWVDYVQPGEYENALMTRLYELKPSDRKTEVDYLLLEGRAADMILEVSEREKCDLIVMGTHGRAGLRRAIMGSVAEEVIRHADCPVATVRPSISLPIDTSEVEGSTQNSEMDLGTVDPSREVTIPVGPYTLQGTLQWVGKPNGVVVFAHGSGSSRFSPRNRFVASELNQAGFATLLLDLLTERESGDRRKVFDIELLASRLAAAAKWISRNSEMAGLPIGLFGASTGSAAALTAAAAQPSLVYAVVSRGGRPDLAWDDLASVKAPTLLIVGGEDEPVLGWNREALEQLTCMKELAIVPGATHLFEEPGTLEQVAKLARDWFSQYLSANTGSEKEMANQSQ